MKYVIVPILVLAATVVAAQETLNPEAHGPDRPTVRSFSLNPDDVRAFPDAPAGFDKSPTNGLAGRIEHLSCGTKDGMFGGPQRMHLDLKAHHIQHIWNVDDAGHDRDTWANNFYHLSQQLFR